MGKLEELNKMFERMEDIEAVQAKIEDIVKGYTK